MNLLTELKLRNLSINECAKKTGISYGALYPLVHGQKKLEKCEYATLKIAPSCIQKVEDLGNNKITEILKLTIGA